MLHHLVTLRKCLLQTKSSGKLSVRISSATDVSVITETQNFCLYIFYVSKRLVTLNIITVFRNRFTQKLFPRVGNLLWAPVIVELIGMYKKLV